MTTDYFSYNDGKDIVPEGAWRLSPSQLSRFFDDTSNWYREMLMNETPAFQGSTSTELGTCVHAGAAMFIDTRSVNHQQIREYIRSLPNDIDKQYILNQYPVMLDTLLNNYLINNIPDKSEIFLWKEVLPNIGVGGSIDALHVSKHKITDFKTTNSLSPPDKFSRAYWFQQVCYAWLCKQNNIPIDTLELVFITTNQVNRISEITNKPMKDYPSQVSVVTHYITNDDWNLIESVVDLICNSVQLWNKQPELRWALAQDYRLKSLFQPQPKLFKLQPEQFILKD
jgi:hypothetical protein